MGAPNHCVENAMELFGGPFASVPFRTFCGLTSTHIYTGESLIYIRFFVMDEAHLLASNFRILFSSYSRRAANCSDQNLFDCGDEICIPQTLICNGRSNCLYRRDEINCDSNKFADILNNLYCSGQIPLLIILTVLFIVVVALCFYYRPCRKNATNHCPNKEERLKRKEQFGQCKVKMNAAKDTLDIGKAKNCNFNSKTMPNLAKNKSQVNSLSNWSLSDLAPVERHHENCQQKFCKTMAKSH
ncbi:hypothetical protein niasHT_030011 [Heterodera trifolii]|uniref:CUB domain-containing protein n=1 Tax=Heterodera trifolii TaxID=157864 RepID=A0ABD2JJN3_9BILA